MAALAAASGQVLDWLTSGTAVCFLTNTPLTPQLRPHEALPGSHCHCCAHSHAHLHARLRARLHARLRACLRARSGHLLRERRSNGWPAGSQC